MVINIEESIIKTLAYFDVFDYPLTLSEIRRYLIQAFDVSDEELQQSISSIAAIQESGGYYYFLGRRNIVEKRIERYDISIHKFVRAKIITKILSKIPTLQYIGVSGSLSMNNSVLMDDIDLFFITKKNTLWISRLLVSVVLLFLGQKRSRGSKYAIDKICPNMFMEEGKLSFPKKMQSLYIAHEIVQLKTLFDRGAVCDSFLNRNKWIKEFLPNIAIASTKRKKNKKFTTLLTSLIKPIEFFCFGLQKIYMAQHRSIEVVSSRLAMFHPVNKEKIIQDLYLLKSERFKELYLDNQWIDKEEARFYFDEKKIRILN